MSVDFHDRTKFAPGFVAYVIAPLGVIVILIKSMNRKFLLPSLCFLISGISLLGMQGRALALDNDGTGRQNDFATGPDFRVIQVTPPERLAMLCRGAQGFVYAVTMTGTTGASR